MEPRTEAGRALLAMDDDKLEAIVGHRHPNAAMGFKRDVAERALRLLEASAWADDTLDLAMDVARYLRIPLDDATWALVMGPRHLRRLGFKVPLRASQDEYLAIVRADVAGQAEAYTHTIYGEMDIREAQGHTFSKVLTDTLARWFSPR